MSPIHKAYNLIFNQEPTNLEDWEISKLVLDNWNISKLGVDLCLQVANQIANHVIFPEHNPELTREIVGHAEALATELSEDLEKTDEYPHMDLIQHITKKRGKGLE